MRLLCLILPLLLLTGCAKSSADNSPVDRTAIARHLEKLVSFGPHPPGSAEQVKVGDYIASELKNAGVEVQTYEFEPITPMGRLKMRNIWGVIPGKTEKVILLGSHYDSKYFKEFSFVGANDGGSSSALLLELVRLLKKNNPTDFTIWCVFFDGEEAIEEWSDLDSLYGSREFVRMLEKRGQLQQIAALFLFDLIGDKDLKIRQDTNSSPSLNHIIWSTAQELGYGSVFVRGATGIVDDHIPFVEKRIPAVDLIDLDYDAWHTAQDTIDKVSVENIWKVGTVFVAALPKLGTALQRKAGTRVP